MKNSFTELGSVAEFINGAAFKPEDWGDEGKRIIRIQNLTDSTKPFNRTTREVAEKLHVHPGDLLVSWSASLGVFEWKEPEIALLNQHIFRVVPNPDRVEKRYLRHGLEGALQEMQRHLHGATMQHVNRGEFLATKLYLPPLAEQRRIAKVLDLAEALRAKRCAALAELDSLTQSLFLDLFGDPATNPKGWTYKALFELGKVVTGGTPSSAIPGMFDGPIPFVTPGDLESDAPVKRSLTSKGADESRTVRAGATMVCCIGATIGKMGIARLKSAFNQQLNAVEWYSGVDDYYGYAAMRFFKPTIKTWGASTTLPILKKSSFEKIEIPVPPLALQQDFARRFQATEKLRAAQKKSLAELDQLFTSLQCRAFKGGL